MGTKMIVEHPGLLTTVQDLGRFGYQQYGMPVAGAMDGYALQAANILAGTPRGEGALEITFSGFSVRFQGSCRVAITGGDLGPRLNNRDIEPWQSLQVESGDVLGFTGVKKGCRAYLAVEGGIKVPAVMGSKSTYIRGRLGGYSGRKLLKGDVLEAGDTDTVDVLPCIKVPREFIPDYDSEVTVRAIAGPQDDYFEEEQVRKFFSAQYRVTHQCDRMGYRLEGPEIKHKKGPDIISDGIALGAVQVPGHGQPIVMMADRQTTGGYTKIANVISVDIPYLAQLKPGDRVSFKETDMEEARKLYMERERLLDRLSRFVENRDNVTRYLIRVKGREFSVTVREIE